MDIARRHPVWPVANAAGWKVALVLLPSAALFAGLGWAASGGTALCEGGVCSSIVDYELPWSDAGALAALRLAHADVLRHAVLWDFAFILIYVFCGSVLVLLLARAGGPARNWAGAAAWFLLAAGAFDMLENAGLLISLGAAESGAAVLGVRRWLTLAGAVPKWFACFPLAALCLAVAVRKRLERQGHRAAP